MKEVFKAGARVIGNEARWWEFIAQQKEEGGGI